MVKGSISIKEIDDYLSGQLDPIHLAEFEKRLREDEDAKENVMHLKKVIEGIQGYAFKEKLKEFHKTFFPPENSNNP